MTEFFDQGDKERNELKIQPQVTMSFYGNKPCFVNDKTDTLIRELNANFKCNIISICTCKCIDIQKFLFTENLILIEINPLVDNLVKIAQQFIQYTCTYMYLCENYLSYCAFVVNFEQQKLKKGNIIILQQYLLENPLIKKFLLLADAFHNILRDI